MAHNKRFGFRPSLAARAAAAREAAKAGRTAEAPAGGPDELRLCGLAAVQARFARDPGSIQRLFFDAETAPRVGAICRSLALTKRIYRQVEPAELEKIAASLHHGGVVAVVTPRPLRTVTPAEITGWAARSEAVLVLDRIGNAHNLGAVARTAAFFGIARIIIPEAAMAARPNDAAHRVAEGGLEAVEVWSAKDLAGTARALAAAGYDVIGAATRGATSVRTVAKALAKEERKPAALVLGNEEHGLAAEVAAACTRLVTMPGSGKVESLNVSVAAGVLMWELMARRRQ